MDGFQSLVQGTAMDLFTQLAAGGIGGNLAGAALRNFSLGAVWNSIAGVIGGAAAAQALFDLGVLYRDGSAVGMMGSQVLAGGLGGASLIILLGLLRSMAAR